MSRSAFSPLPYQVRADLFAHLAAMEKAGLPTSQAYGLLRLPKIAQPRLENLRAYLTRGVDPATAGSRSGMFTPLETSLLRAALMAGSPAPTYKRLADSYATKALQLKQIRSRMMMPVATLTAALFIQPLPALAGGSIGAGAYLWQALRPLLMLGGLAVLALRGPAWYLSGPPTPARIAVGRLLLKVPLFGPMHARRNARDFFESLALLVEAGVPIFDALPSALATVHNTVLRADFATVLPQLKRGATLAEALAGLREIDTERVLSFVQTGEGSGTLPEMLFRHVGTETEDLGLFQQQVADWLPRIFYALVAGWMASQLLAAPPAPVPADLGIG